MTACFAYSCCCVGVSVRHVGKERTFGWRDGKKREGGMCGEGCALWWQLFIVAQPNATQCIKCI